MSNTSDAIADATTYSKTHLTGHIGVFKSNTNIADALDYTNLPSGVRSKIWTAFDAADAVGLPVADLGQPADYDHDPFNLTDSVKTSVGLTLAECEDSYASRVAHAFWVELFQDFPWSMLKYDLESCQALFAAEEAFVSSAIWQGWAGTPPLVLFTDLVEYSPRRAWDKASAILSSPTSPNIAAAQIFEQHRLWASPYGLSHGQEGYPPIDVTDTYNASNVVDEGPGFGNQYAGHEGCWFACELMRSLLCAVNIPAERLEFKFQSRNHASLLMPTLSPVTQHPDLGDPPLQGDTGLVLVHGDDLYFLDGNYQISGLNMCANRRYWDANIGPDNMHSEFKYSIRHQLYAYMMWSETSQGRGLMAAYGGPSGWRALRAAYGPGLDFVAEPTLVSDLRQWGKERNGGVEKDAAGTIYEGSSSIESDHFTSVGFSGGGVSWLLNTGWFGYSAGDALLSIPVDVDFRMEVNHYKGNIAYQFCDDGDFELEVKWTSVPTTADEAIGLIAYQSDTLWVGATLYDNAGTLYLKGGLLSGVEGAWAFDVDVSATITGSTAYVKMGRTKSTDSWTVEYSANGSSWTEPTGSPFTSIRTIGRVGVYVANGGTQVAQASHTLDYFFENSARIP